ATMLSVSPLNVRKVQNDTADAQLRADIVARGILQNLIGIATPRKKGRFDITAGGRRLTQVHAAIAAGKLPDDFAVPVLVMGDKADAQEASLAENFQRLAMNPADECIAFQHIIAAEKATVANVAKRFGLTERFVQGRLRLAGLADVVFTALRDGDITLDIAMAYAATTDTARQAAVFAQTQNYSYGVNATSIRRSITEGGYSGSHPSARLIGREAYIAAGGTIDGDLFADTEAETWINRDLVDRLAAEKLAAAASEIAAIEGLAEVRVVGSEHEIWSAARDLDRLVVDTVPLSDEQTARQEVIETELAEFEGEAEERELTLEEEARVTILETELETMVNPAPALTDEQKASAIAFVYTDRQGEICIHHQVYTAPVQTNDGDDDDGSTTGDAPTAAPKTGISQQLAEELAHQKVEMVAVHVASDPHFALDLATFIMIDKGVGSRVPSELRAPSPASRIGDFQSNSTAAAELARLSLELDRSWTDLATPEARFDAFRALDAGAKAAWLGVAVARTLCPVPMGKTGSGFIDHLGRSLEIDVAAWWRPTSENYFDRVSKPMILGAFVDVGGPELSARYTSAKKADLSAAAAKLFRGEAIVEASTKTAALAWIPPSMAFETATATGVAHEPFDGGATDPADGASPEDDEPGDEDEAHAALAA
ncbi:MAG: ParB/RepB/Spo0J family partition protein, partial [Janthinobacterium lividum]